MQTIIVVDIDGTISDASERASKFLNPTNPNWNAFYNDCGNDKPIKDMLKFVEALSYTYKIIFCTGRRKSTDALTRKWFHTYMKDFRYSNKGVNGLEILYREDNDHRRDTDVKPELLANYLAMHPYEKVGYILEDRNSVVQKWRELGYRCLQVADGNF